MDCYGCAYEFSKKNKGCKIFTQKPDDCRNFTSEEEAERREREINKYMSYTALKNEGKGEK